MSDELITSTPLTRGTSSSSPVGPSDSKPVVSSDSDVPEVTPLRTNDGDDETKTVIDDNLPIKLTSSDEKEFTVPYKTICKSILIKNLLDDVGIDSDEPIPLPNVTSEILEKVLEWCEYHVNDPEPFEDDFEDEFAARKSVTICEWDRDFYEVPQDQLFDIMLAANYLHIKLLLDIGCKTVANMIKGKTPQEIRDTFGIENDFTPEEEEAIRRENEWAEER